MYYHCLSLRYVEYGTILPHDDETGWNRPAYQWLGTYCGYFPQIWLSRADIGMTGYRSALRPRINRGRQRRVLKDQVLFGFDYGSALQTRADVRTAPYFFDTYLPGIGFGRDGGKQGLLSYLKLE
jgi:hypothetical protein